MDNKLSWSNFLISIELPTGVFLIKSTLTGAIVALNRDDKIAIDRWVSGDGEKPFFSIDHLVDKNVGLLVEKGSDEHWAWRNRLIHQRNNAAHIFVLHFLPTTYCQLECAYCFEKGVTHKQKAKSNLIAESRKWLDAYFRNHPEINTFRLVFFGGEPLLRRDLVAQAAESFHSLAQEHKLNFWCELTSNGELLDESTAMMLSRHEWHRVQITLDGLKDVHDIRRHGKNMRPTFDRIMQNIRMLLSTNHIEIVDIRISLDSTNADSVSELVRFLAALDYQDRINLSFGFITSTLENPNGIMPEQNISEKILSAWKVAKDCGFKIPDELVVGPWCVAIAKHSAVLQPNGALQKCFCTVGREKYDFGTIYQPATETYLRDQRFEHFDRTDLCIKEKCPYLPMCGGGCVHDAIVANGKSDGFGKRFCQKKLLKEINEGLLLLTCDD